VNGDARRIGNTAPMIALKPAPASLPPGQRIYAVGDVHGCAEQLELLHRLIAADLAERPHAEPLIVHIGDYVDRGPDSAAVIERLLAPFPVPAARVIALCGNHEAMALEALETADADVAEHWLGNGGGATLASWGVARHARPQQWQGAVPNAHLEFLRHLPRQHAAGGYVFVHAGLRPGVPLAQQTDSDMLWIREPFLSWSGALPGVVVHGHTPQRKVTVRANRIGIDTGAVWGGPLTCVVLEGDRFGVLQA
jgi:serine/threonine protein phosphatase 1